jgi:hypothetical protein
MAKRKKVAIAVAALTAAALIAGAVQYRRTRAKQETFTDWLDDAIESPDGEEPAAEVEPDPVQQERTAKRRTRGATTENASIEVTAADSSSG